MRKPYAAGGFYPATREELLEILEWCEKNSEKVEIEGKIIAGIVPHAGYIYSGPCAATFYKNLEENSYDTVIVLGTNHTGLGEKASLLVTEKYLTPLGEIDPDIEFGKKLIESVDFAYESPEAHYYEHSIEVQLPFLQKYLKTFKLVPIVVSHLSIEEARALAEGILSIAEETGKKILVIASSDFTHHGKIYGYEIFKESPNEKVRGLDLEYIERILKLDSKGFYDLLFKYNGTVCGYSSIAVIIELSRVLNLKSKLLCYYTSADVSGDESIIVGYSSIAFYKDNN